MVQLQSDRYLGDQTFSSISRISDTATHDRPPPLSTLNTTSCTRQETLVPALSTNAYNMQIGREGRKEGGRRGGGGGGKEGEEEGGRAREEVIQIHKKK